MEGFIEIILSILSALTFLEDFGVPISSFVTYLKAMLGETPEEDTTATKA